MKEAWSCGCWPKFAVSVVLYGHLIRRRVLRRITWPPLTIGGLLARTHLYAGVCLCPPTLMADADVRQRHRRSCGHSRLGYASSFNRGTEVAALGCRLLRPWLPSTGR